MSLRFQNRTLPHLLCDTDANPNPNTTLTLIPKTLNPKTLNPQPSTLTLKPQRQNRTLPHLLCDLLAMAIDASFEERLAILDTLELAPRFELGLQLLRRQLLVLKTASQVGETLSSRSRLSSNSKGGNRGRTVLRGPRGGEQDGAAGGAAEEESTLARLQRMVAEANMPPEALKAASQGLKKVADMEQRQQMGPEHQKTVAWLEWMVELPWSKSTSQEREMDLSLARQRLDDDHYGLEKIKRRIVEYAAVRWLNPGAKGSILCLVGTVTIPPSIRYPPPPPLSPCRTLLGLSNVC